MPRRMTVFRTARKALIAFALGMVLSAGCASAPYRHNFVNRMEQAHGREVWSRTEAMTMDIELRFVDQPPLQLSYVFETNGPRIRAETKDNVLLVYDGEEAYIYPAEVEFPRARFHLLSWPWFVVSPMKLRGKDVRLERMSPMLLDGRRHQTMRMMFAPGTGDTPGDRYILYMAPDTGLLAAQAYIVTYGARTNEAEKTPHAMTYHDYVTVGGVTLARHWKVWRWDIDLGLYGDPLGEADIRHIRFVNPSPDAFEVPDDARRLPLPPINQRQQRTSFADAEGLEAEPIP